MDIAVQELNEYNRGSFDEFYASEFIIIQDAAENFAKFYAVNESLRRIYNEKVFCNASCRHDGCLFSSLRRQQLRIHSAC
jgi:hypothetical protein